MNNKIKTILFASLITALILPFSAMDFAEAEKKSDIVQDKDKEKFMKMVEKEATKLSKHLTKADKDRIHDKIKSDHKTKDLTNNKELKFISNSYHGKLTNLENGSDTPLDVIMHYEIDGQAFTVVVDGETEEILDMKLRTEELGPLLPSNGLVVDYLNWNNPSIDGLRMDLDAPNFTYQNLGWTALLLNAQKDDQTWGICSPSQFPDAYWAQVGLIFTSAGPDFYWADTTTSCNPQSLFTGVYTGTSGNPSAASAGDDLVFQITADDTTNSWVLYAYNFSTSDYWYHQQTVSNTTVILDGTPNTSIFFENPNVDNEGWDAGFAADPKVNKGYERRVSNGGWYNWSTEILNDYNCDPGGQPTSTYVSGNLQTGLTFDVSDIDKYCGI